MCGISDISLTPRWGAQSTLPMRLESGMFTVNTKYCCEDLLSHSCNISLYIIRVRLYSVLDFNLWLLYITHTFL